MTEGEHAPARPAWTCAACGQDWPCEPARVQLIQEYGERRVNLAVHMATELGYAAAELHDATPTELYLRFVAWTRP